MDIRSRLAKLKGEEAAPPPEVSSGVVSVRERLARMRRTAEEVPIQRVVDGVLEETALGTVFVSETVYPVDAPGAMVPAPEMLDQTAATVAWLSGDPRLATMRAEETLFIDLETTGLGGTGAYPFMIGVAWYRERRLHVQQLFMLGPSYEAAVLAWFRDLAAPFRYVVSYNGKTFDAHLLTDRFVLHRMTCPLLTAPHFDVLFPARRVWGSSADNCRLTTLEKHVLNFDRGRDIDGSLIPALYYHYVSSGQTSGLAAVFRHNTQDLVSLVALAGALLRACEAPPVEQGSGPTSRRALDEQLALGLLHLRQGNITEGMHRLEKALACGRRSRLQNVAWRELSLAYKRQGDIHRAVALWREMLVEAPFDPFPYEELAKWAEHHQRDVEAALAWIRQGQERAGWTPQFHRRQERLERRARGS
ncbi:MAG: ribonuclease H-like domain-containing protein [Candidatus Xenobia bacterium]